MLLILPSLRRDGQAAGDKKSDRSGVENNMSTDLIRFSFENNEIRTVRDNGEMYKVGKGGWEIV